MRTDNEIAYLAKRIVRTSDFACPFCPESLKHIKRQVGVGYSDNSVDNSLWNHVKEQEHNLIALEGSLERSGLVKFEGCACPVCEQDMRIEMHNATGRVNRETLQMINDKRWAFLFMVHMILLAPEDRDAHAIALTLGGYTIGDYHQQVQEVPYEH